VRPVSSLRRAAVAGAVAAPVATEVAAAQETPAQAPESPDIIPRPNDGEGRESNEAGLLIGAGMLVAWGVGGVVMFRRATHRRSSVT
jgi:hypothetical protein